MAVRTPTTRETAERSRRTAEATPKNIHVAAFYSGMEWWRTHATHLPPKSDQPFHVLSLANGSPDYDKEVLVNLMQHYPKLSYTIVEPSKSHQKLADLTSQLVISPAASFDEFAETPAAKPSSKQNGVGFDLIHVALWRNQQWENTLAVLLKARSLLNRNGTLVTFNVGNDGAYILRTSFAEMLGEPIRGSAALSEIKIVNGLFESGLSPEISVLPSMVDLTDVVNFKTPPALAFSTMSTLLLSNIESAAKLHPELVAELYSELRDTSVAARSDRCVAYAPISVVVSTASPTAPFAPASPVVAVTQAQVDPWWPHGKKGGFLNQGLQNWHNIRDSWKSYDPDAERIPKPKLVGVKKVVEGLSTLRRTFELPAPLALSDILDIYIDIWDSE